MIESDDSQIIKINNFILVFFLMKDYIDYITILNKRLYISIKFCEIQKDKYRKKTTF